MRDKVLGILKVFKIICLYTYLPLSLIALVWVVFALPDLSSIQQCLLIALSIGCALFCGMMVELIDADFDDEDNECEDGADEDDADEE